MLGFRQLVGYRNPTLRELFTEQQFGDKKLIGGHGFFLKKYDVINNSIFVENIDRFNEQVLRQVYPDDPDVIPVEFTQAQLSNLDLLKDGVVSSQYASHLRPEQLVSFELGYRNLLVDGNLVVDVNSYFNVYNNMIGFAEVVGTDTSPLKDLFLAANQANSIAESERYSYFAKSTSKVKTAGISALVDYTSTDYFILGLNMGLNWIQQSDNDPIAPGFNTPNFRINISAGHRQIAGRLGFKYTLRIRSAFDWESNFESGRVESYSVSDVQFNYNIHSISSVLKAGFSNVGNEYYTDVYGGPRVGAIFYLSATYNLNFNKQLISYDEINKCVIGNYFIVNRLLQLG